MKLFPWIFFLVASSCSIQSESNTFINLDFPASYVPHEFESSNPDIVWKPAPRDFVIDPHALYIDYESGNDSNPGTIDRPVKHHPWDPNAADRVKELQDIKTYYFKKGVTYRGELIAQQSGNDIKDTELTIHPEWGEGEAEISGAVRISNGWKQCSNSENLLLPESSVGKTWCMIYTSLEPPTLLWLLTGEDPARIPIARFPNKGKSSDFDIRSDWNTLDGSILELKIQTSGKHNFKTGDSLAINHRPSISGKIIETGDKWLVVETTRDEHKHFKKGARITNGKSTSTIARTFKGDALHLRLIDEKSLSKIPENLKNVSIFVEPFFIPQPVSSPVLRIDNKESSIRVNLKISAQKSPAKGSRYLLEGSPGLLDIDGEYAYVKLNKSKYLIYLRLPKDTDPNNSILEIATRNRLVQINNISNIRISGLHFKFSNNISTTDPRAKKAHLHAAAVSIRGRSSGITIDHCKFSHVPAGIFAYPESADSPAYLDHISITDNMFHDIDGSAIALGNGTARKYNSHSESRLINISILRNWFNDIGFRTVGHRGASGVGIHGDAIQVSGGEIVDIGYNVARNIGGSGINLSLGTINDGVSYWNRTLRGMIHHNKVTNSVLSRYDAGGIQVWNGGPVYIYNNISGNPVGYRNNANYLELPDTTLHKSSYGIGIYLDSNYKAYVFNNIVWGITNDTSLPIYNAAALNEALGFNHLVFNNTFFRFAAGLHKGMMQHNRNLYLGNILIDMSEKFIMHNTLGTSIEHESIGFKNNIFKGRPKVFGQLGKGKHGHDNLSISDWKTLLSDKLSLQPETGQLVDSDIVSNAEQHDFRLHPSSPAIGKGIKTFIPWSLNRVVGEWNFYQTKTIPIKIFGENINMDSEWVDRLMLDQIPRNDLICNHSDHNNFSDGPLENWIMGALKFNGRDQFCILTNESLLKGYTWHVKHGGKILSGEFPPYKRDTVDIDTDNFLIESVILVNDKAFNTGILQKHQKKGYELLINKQGYLQLSMDFGYKSNTRTSNIPIHDNQWHHVVVEVNRNLEKGINIYIDGKLSNGDWDGASDISESLSNNGDFIVGRSDTGYFSGKIDYLRISKGTLTDAKTTIEKLRQWQFSGPFLKDFSGQSTKGSRLNAGAVEQIR